MSPFPHVALALPLALQDALPPGGSAAQPSAPSMWPLLIGMLLIMYFIVIRPERKERKRKEALIGALKKNDRVITTGGMYASVAAVNESDLTLKFDDGPTRVRVLKSAIGTVLKDEDKDAGGKGDKKE